MVSVKRERDIERAVCNYASQRGWLPIKFVSVNKTGVPDRVMLGHGRVLFMEFKTKTGKLSPRQRRLIELFLLHGHEVHVVDSVERGMDIIDAQT